MNLNYDWRMVDIVQPDVRSRMMSGIRGTDTRPELLLRKGLHSKGFRYRLHDKSLPGKPDLVFPKYNAVVFMNGCFWHGHGCHLFKWPKSRKQFWRDKITATMERDKRNIIILKKLGWRTGQIWECALKGKREIPLEYVFQDCAKWLKGSVIKLEIQGDA